MSSSKAKLPCRVFRRVHHLFQHLFSDGVFLSAFPGADSLISFLLWACGLSRYAACWSWHRRLACYSDRVKFRSSRERGWWPRLARSRRAAELSLLFALHQQSQAAPAGAEKPIAGWEAPPAHSTVLSSWLRACALPGHSPRGRRGPLPPRAGGGAAAVSGRCPAPPDVRVGFEQDASSTPAPRRPLD